MRDWLGKYWWAVGLLAALLVTLFSPLASAHPDGLERVAEDQGFIDRAEDALYEVVPDYMFPGIANEGQATILAGLLGTVVIFGLTSGLVLVLRQRSSRTVR